jgi:hypothetical protein
VRGVLLKGIFNKISSNCFVFAKVVNFGLKKHIFTVKYVFPYILKNYIAK